jgi:hypothetical protein
MVDEAIVGEKGTVGGQDWSWGVGCGNELNAWGGGEANDSQREIREIKRRK